MPFPFNQNFAQGAEMAFRSMGIRDQRQKNEILNRLYESQMATAELQRQKMQQEMDRRGKYGEQAGGVVRDWQSQRQDPFNFPGAQEKPDYSQLAEQMIPLEMQYGRPEKAFEMIKGLMPEGPEEYTLSAGAGRYRGAEQIAQQPFKPEGPESLTETKILILPDTDPRKQAYMRAKKDLRVGSSQTAAQNYMIPSGEVVLSYDGGRSYISKDGASRSMPPGAFKVSATVSLGEIETQKAKTQAAEELGLGAGPTTTPGGGLPEGPTMEEHAHRGTGPWAMLEAVVDNIAGGVGVDKLFGAKGLFPDTMGSRQTLRILKQRGKAALMNSSRGAIWEQQRIDELFPDPERLWRNPRTESKKFQQLRGTLITEKEYNNRSISRAVTAKEVQRLRQSNEEIDRLLTLLGKPEEQSFEMLTNEDNALIDKYIGQGR